MPARVLALVFRVASVVAIAASAALVVDYSNAGDPAFCGVGSGCMAVRMSSYSKVFGVPLPWIGLCAFALLLLFSLVARTAERRAWLTAAATAGGVFGLVLVSLQAFAVHAFCKWCIAVDTSAVVAAVSAILLQRSRAKLDGAALDATFLPRNYEIAWLVTGVLATAIPFVWGEFPTSPPLPEDIAKLQVPGKITVVSFTDFECPFCRKLHPTLGEIRKDLGDDCAFVREMVPLEMHPGALPAARAYVCTPAAKRDQLADMLYAAPPQMLNKMGTIGIAHGLGVDENQLRSCFDSKATQAEIDDDKAIFERVGVKAVPLTFVADRVVMGLNPDRLKRAVKMARQHRPALPVAGMLALLAAIFAGVFVASWRAFGKTDEKS